LHWAFGFTSFQKLVSKAGASATKKPLSRTLVRERGIKQRYARFSAGGIALRWHSSTCCLKNSMIILPQTRGVVKYFFEISCSNLQ
jgi:hypothetical protein